MQVILERDRKDAVDYMVELINDWSDPVPMTDMTGIGEELYRLLKDDFCMVLPELNTEQLNRVNEYIISDLQDPDMDTCWAVDSLFTLMEDEGLIEIRKW